MSPDNRVATRPEEFIILIVEDDNVLREALAEALRILGYQAFAAANGSEALVAAHRIKEQRVDLVISDLVMPGMNALELYEALRAEMYRGQMLVITGYPMPHTGESLVSRPGVVWASKPIGMQELESIVRRMVDAKV